MNASNSSTKKFKNKDEKSEDLSKNHHKRIRYRLRLQDEKEAEEEIKHYGNDQKRVS